MIRTMLVLYALSGAMAVGSALAGEAKTVKPSSVETKKEADTQIFVTTAPEGAKVIIDGKDVGSSPYLLPVPEGATRLTIVVELDGYEKGQRTVEVRGGKVTRVTFDLKKDEAAARSPGNSKALGAREVTEAFHEDSPSASRPAKSEPEDHRAVARRFGEALAAADREVLDEYWNLEDPLDRQAADLIIDTVRKATRVSGRPPRVDLVHCARTGADSMTACYLAEAIPLFGEESSPIFQPFRLKNGRWRTVPISHLRSVALAREQGPEALGRRALVRRLIDLRFGTVSPEERLASMRASADALEALSRPPYNLSQFGRSAEAIRGQLEEHKEVQTLAWPEIEKKVLSDEGMADVGSPGDSYLLFYLEASEGEDGRRLPGPSEGETLLVERLPCLTDQEVEKAEIVLSPDGVRPSVMVQLDEFGARVFGRATKESIGKRVAIVVDGKVVSAPIVRSEIAGGRALISGSFTASEAEKIAEQLNSHREQIRKMLESMREKLEAWPEKR